MEQESSTNNQNLQEEVQIRHLKIKTLTETVYELKVPANMLIKDLRLKVQELSGVPPERQRMICMGQQLLDQKTVGDYAKDPSQPNWIHLVAKVQQSTQKEQSQTQNVQQQQQTPQQQQQQQYQQQQQNNRNRQGFDMFGGNVQIQSGNVGDLNQLLGNISNFFNLPNSRQQPQQQQNTNQLSQQQQQQNPTQAPQISVQIQSIPNLFSNQTQNIQTHSQTSTIRSNLLNNQQPISIQRQIQLPHQELLNLGTICNNLMGTSSTFPGPPLPQIPNRTTGPLIGSFLSNWQFQVQRTLPFVHRLAELLQRENYMNISTDRAQTQALSLEVGRALNELIACTQPIVGILSDLQLGPNPGIIRFEQNSHPPSQTHSLNPPQQPNQQANAPIQENNNTTLNNNSTTTPSNTTQQQKGVQQSSGQTVQTAAISTQQPITSVFQQQPQQPQATQNNTASNQNSAQQQQQQPQANNTQNSTSSNSNPLNDLISQISGGVNGEVRIGVMNQSLDNDSEIQIVGIGQTQIVDSDQNINIQQMLGNIMDGVRTGTTTQNNGNNQQINNQEEEWDSDDENTIGIEMSSTINLNGNNNFIQNLLSGLGLQNNGNTNININTNNGNIPSIQTTTISGSQAANLISQLNRQTQQLNIQQQNQQQQSQQQNQSQSQQQEQQQQQQQQQQQNVSSQFQVSESQTMLNQTQSQNSQQNFEINAEPQQQNSLAQQQQQQPQVNQLNGISMMMGGGNSGFNSFGTLLGNIGGGLGFMMNMTVDELIRENMSSQDEQNETDELVMNIIGQLRISDLVSSFVSGQFGFLDTIQEKIREQIRSRNLGSNQLIDRNKVSHQLIKIGEQFSEQLAQQLSQYLIVPEKYENLIFEGIEPHNIALDIMDTRLPEIYDIIFRDFPPDGTEKFSTEFVYELKKIAGEVFSEISECLHGEINDLEKIFRTWVNESIEKIVGEESHAITDSLITSMLWDKIKKLVLIHKDEQNEEQKENNDPSQSGQMEIEKPVQTQQEQELDLLEDIEIGLEKDQIKFERYNINLSEEYKKGDFIHKN